MADSPTQVDTPQRVTLSSDPRAQRGIRRTKSFAALATFAVIALGSYYLGHSDLFTAIIRGLVTGLLVYFVAWWTAQLYWKTVLKLYHTPPPEDPIEEETQEENPF